MIFFVSVQLFVALAPLGFLTFVFTLLLTSFPPISFTFLSLPITLSCSGGNSLRSMVNFLLPSEACNIISLFGRLGVVVIPRQGGIVAPIPYEIHSTA